MDATFTATYNRLNTRQRQAVDTTEGAVLVLAGPGTGKTQLLSTRAAKIVSLGSANPSNILCLTYTEAGAAEMRSRLTALMGVQGGEVAVYTFHGFGSWLINQYPEQFSRERSLSPLDDLERYTIFQNILGSLPFRHPLAVRDEDERFIRQHAVQEIVRAYKEAGLSPQAVKTQLRANQSSYKQLQPLLDELFSSSLSAKRLPAIRALAEAYLEKATEGSYIDIVTTGLLQAIETAEAAGKTAAIGAWRDAHTRLKDGVRLLKSSLDHSLLIDTADIYSQYQDRMTAAGKFDYEDMILWATEALQTHPDMLLDVAERFQYIMVDEYQDTNGAQNTLLNVILHANPVDSPNVLVVGDDDQAIMRFQGAELSGMLGFIETYKPTIISLEDNYRSNQPILDASMDVIQHSDERLINNAELEGITKVLRSHAASSDNPLQLSTYLTPSIEYNAVAQRIAKLIEQGVMPEQIGVIGRKHAVLTECIPYLQAHHIPVTYDKREDILNHSAIQQLLRLATYLDRLATRPKRAEMLLPAVLADAYWQLEPLDSYHIAAAAKATKTSWIDVMLAGKGAWREIAEWLVAAADATHTNNFTQMFDILIGRTKLANTALQASPFRHTYDNQPPQTYATILSHLIRLRSAVLDANASAHTIADAVAVCMQYKQSNIRLVDNNIVLRGGSEGVQLMSAHGSKGREFDYVFVLSCVDESWGSRARSNNQRIRLPENMPLYPAGDALSDRVRLLYVAMTRARQQLYVSAHMSTNEGQRRTPLSFLQSSLENNTWNVEHIDSLPATPDAAVILETAWHPTAAVTERSLADVIEPLTKQYRLSPTALRDFLDVCYSGPRTTIEKHVLGFPSAYNAHSALGSAVHKTLQGAHSAYKSGAAWGTATVLTTFDAALDASNLTESELAPARQHGHQFLPRFVDQFSNSDFAAITDTELFLRGESPMTHTPLSGVIDAVATHQTGIRIIDYKTGKPPLPDWQTKGLSESKKISLHFYRQQLLFYAVLAQASGHFTKPIISAELVFTEDSVEKPGSFVRLKIDDFDAQELARTEQLIATVHTRICNADLPDIENYPKNLTGILAFESDLLATT
jgi:DNA helicase II / ATP-dependent DNA helicase PcrA